MESFEIEIKSLLGSRDNAEALIERMRAADPEFKEHGEHTQLNHYFEGGDLKALQAVLAPHLPEDRQQQFAELAAKARDYSVRTRQADTEVIFVMKLSIDDTTSSNGTARLEFECTLPMTLDQLDRILLDAGFTYQAKWSRERRTYTYRGATVTIDRNAGYGYVAEFESVVDDPSRADEVKAQLRATMAEVGAEELNQDRLARMFDHYNKNWQDYYGTEKVFTIE